jgi:hypothetical protein
MPLYSSVPMNIKVYSSVTSNRGIYWGPRPRVPWPDVHIFLGPRNILFLYIYNLCFSYLPGWGASKTDHTSNLYNNTYSFDTTRHKSMKICSIHTIIHSLHTKICIVFTQGHNKTYITVPRSCQCHHPRPRRILPCLELHR